MANSIFTLCEPYHFYVLSPRVNPSPLSAFTFVCFFRIWKYGASFGMSDPPFTNFTISLNCRNFLRMRNFISRFQWISEQLSHTPKQVFFHLFLLQFILCLHRTFFVRVLPLFSTLNINLFLIWLIKYHFLLERIKNLKN